MKFSFALLCLGVFLVTYTFGQTASPPADTTYWRRTLNLGINFNQAAFSSNWQAGGVNSIALGSLLLGKADYQRDRLTASSQLDLQYGIVNNAGQGFRKTIDRILMDVKIGRVLTKKWNLFLSANFLTQFAPGFRYETDAQGEDQAVLISRFLAPGFLTSTWGLEFKPDAYLWVRFSPFAPRFTFVTDTTIYQYVPANYGVEIGRRMRYEWLASQLVANYDRTFQDKLTLKIRYTMFANFETLAFNTIDHRLNISVAAKVTRHVNVSLTIMGIYDRDQNDHIQYSQALALGLLYTIGER